MRKTIPALLIVAGYVFSTVAYVRLPAAVSLRWDALIPWVAFGNAEAIPRAFAAFGLPTLAFLIWLLLLGVASSAGERLGRRVFPGWLVSPRTGAAAVERFEPTFDTIVSVILACLLSFHAVTLGMVLGWPTWTLHAFGALVGVSLMVVGNVMPRTRPNWVAGLRTRRTLSDPELWRRTHRLFGGLLMATGVIVVAASILSAPYALLIGVVGMLVSALVASVIAPRSRAGRRVGEPPTLALLLVLVLSGATALVAQTPAPRPGGDSDPVETPFDVTSTGLVLPGTLTLPADVRGPIPVAVIVDRSSK
jgi:hypothetical protein